MAVEVGSIAPEFSIPDQNGERVSLSQFKGQKNVVFAWYPAAFTSG
ncbi:MAG: redoxin domain-containing protein [Dehalococcoidia bacterium]|nr:redoxin domain-containing protein [Dehalococcoidia bacterium]